MPLKEDLNKGIVPCKGCPVVAICRTKYYPDLLKGCSKIKNLTNFTTRIVTSIRLIEEELKPIHWEYEIDRKIGGSRLIILEKTDKRYQRIEDEYDLVEHAYFDVTEGMKCAK